LTNARRLDGHPWFACLSRERRANMFKDDF
jgi:hypothetical protein